MLAAQGQRSFWGAALPAAQPCSCRPQIASTIEAAHKKGGGSTKNGRDSNGQRRGVKVYGGQPVKAGGIIVRQVGCKVAQPTAHPADRTADRPADGGLLQFHPGVGVRAAVDWSLYAVKEGIVVFSANSKQQKVSLLAFCQLFWPLPGLLACLQSHGLGLNSCGACQISVVPTEEYERREDHVTKPDSRRAKRQEFFAANAVAGRRTSYDKAALAAALAQ